jgi:hypothetical protein
MGHGEKNSRRAYLVSIASISRIQKCSQPGLSRAITGLMQCNKSATQSPHQRGEQRKGHTEAERFGVPHFLATQYLGTTGIKAHHAAHQPIDLSRPSRGGYRPLTLSCPPPRRTRHPQSKSGERSHQQHVVRNFFTEYQFSVQALVLTARSQGRLVHLVSGWRGDAEFGGDCVDRVLGDGEVHPTVGGEIRADVTLVVLLRFLAGQPAQEGSNVVDSQTGLFGDRDKGSPVGSH